MSSAWEASVTFYIQGQSRSDTVGDAVIVMKMTGGQKLGTEDGTVVKVELQSLGFVADCDVAMWDRYLATNAITFYGIDPYAEDPSKRDIAVWTKGAPGPTPYVCYGGVCLPGSSQPSR